WREPANPSVEQQLAHLIVRKDGTVCVADGDTIVAVTAEGRRPFLDGPAPGAKVGALAEDRLGRLWVATEEGIHRRDGDRWTRVPIPEGLRPRTLGRALAAGDRVHFLPVAEDRGVMAVTWDGAALRRLDAAEV